MIFSSNVFVYLFLPISLSLYFFLYKIAHKKVALLNLTLIILSIFFYLWGTGEYVGILLVSIVLNYIFGKLIHLKRWSNYMLALGIIINLMFLFYFKYTAFFIHQLSKIVPTLFYKSRLIEYSAFLPIGISFYTFMAISYLCDVYRKKIKPASLTHFATYLSLFPHLIAGPIVRYKDIQDEIEKREVNSKMFFNGFVRFSFGLGKKVIIANNLGFIVDKIFSLPPTELSFVLGWVGIILYTFQIYYDFSGYTDIALGLVQFFGFHFPENFNSPYKAVSITDFWKRWHISLSSWFRDYIYIPLGGNRKGEVRTYFNLLVVFLLCGLWHGAAWTFVVWGIYHGVLLIIERWVKNKFHFEAKNKLFIIPTFILVMVGWVIFRSPTLDYAISYSKTLFSFSNISFISHYYKLSYYLSNNIIFFSVVAAFFSFVQLPKSKSAIFNGSVAILILIYSLSILAKTSFTPFIYFQF